MQHFQQLPSEGQTQPSLLLVGYRYFNKGQDRVGGVRVGNRDRLEMLYPKAFQLQIHFLKSALDTGLHRENKRKTLY